MGRAAADYFNQGFAEKLARTKHEGDTVARYIPDPSLKRQIPGGAPPPIYG